MFLLIISYFLIFFFGLSILLGNFLYYKFFPERKTLAKLAESKHNSLILESGNRGVDGLNGIDGKKAVNGQNGLKGDRGNHGVSGNKSINVGQKGSIGKDGMLGLNGVHGTSGSKGPPSNAIVPLVLKTYDNVYRLSPVTVEHDFSVENERYKLSITYVFDEISMFNFEHGKDNQKFKIDTISGGYTNVSPTISAKTVYGSVSLFLEQSDSQGISDGIAFYVAPPVVRNGYLFVTSENLGNNLVINENLNEKIISTNRTFGLDFVTKENDVGNIYTYMVGGLFGYKIIVNIYPPLPNFYYRMIENTSDNRIGNKDAFLPQIKFPAKGGAIKITDDDRILLISPRLNVGNLVIKDSSNANALWESTNFKDFPTYFSNQPVNSIIGAFDYIENDINSFTSGLTKSSSSLVLSEYLSDPYENLRVYTIKSGNESANYSTTASINNIKIVYPNTPFPLTYPTILNNSTLYVEFFVSINKSSFLPFRYRVLLKDDVRMIERYAGENEFLITDTLFISNPSLNSAFSNQKPDENLYYSIRIDNNKSLTFDKVFGRRISFDVSSSNAHIIAHPGNIFNYYKSPIDNDHPFTEYSAPFPLDAVKHNSIQLAYTRLKHGIVAFNTNGTHNGNSLMGAFIDTKYDFIQNHPDVTYGWEFDFNSRNLEISNGFFVIGYRTPSGDLLVQNVIGRTQSSGECYVDVPIDGYR